MKKKYIKPIVEVCVIENYDMLAASPGFDREYGTGDDEAAKNEFDCNW